MQAATETGIRGRSSPSNASTNSTTLLQVVTQLISMVYVRDDTTEEITGSYQTRRDGTNGVVIETDDRYFEYWFPIRDAPKYTAADKVLDPLRMTIIEAPNQENESQYDGTDDVTVPTHVAEKAEEITGYDLLE